MKILPGRPNSPQPIRERPLLPGTSGRFPPPRAFFTGFFLVFVLALWGCASHVVITQPYHEKIRIGDGVKLLARDGTIHSGRIVYSDRASVVIRTPRQTKAHRPVQVAQFGTTVPWSEVVGIKVAGTLDSRNALISSEEIRINVRTNHRRNLAVNLGLLGLGAHFLAGTHVQDRFLPDTPSLSDHNRGRMAFWAIFSGGSLASSWLGYRMGEFLDHRNAITRIERQREQQREILRNSLPDSQKTPPPTLPQTGFPPPRLPGP